MIYTVGRTDWYESYFRAQKCPRKLGRILYLNGTMYEGGSVWRTREAAEAHAPDGYSVYGVHADWDHDTVAVPKQVHHALLHNSPLEKL